MPEQSGQERFFDRVILLLLFALFLLLSPVIEWWASPERPWYAPYLVWGLIILLSYLLQRRLRRHDL